MGTLTNIRCKLDTCLAIRLKIPSELLRDEPAITRIQRIAHGVWRKPEVQKPIMSTCRNTMRKTARHGRSADATQRYANGRTGQDESVMLTMSNFVNAVNRNHESPQQPAVTTGCALHSASVQLNLMSFCPNRAAGVLYASLPLRIAAGTISMSTTATLPAQYVDYSAQIATSASASSRTTQPCCSEQPHI